MLKMFRKKKKEETNAVKDIYNCIDYSSVTVNDIEELIKRTQNMVYSTNKEA